MGTVEIFPGRILKCGRHFEREKKFNFSTRDPGHLRAYGASFSKNRFVGTTHGDKPLSQNGISLRSLSLIMAPEEVFKRLEVWSEVAVINGPQKLEVTG